MERSIKPRWRHMTKLTIWVKSYLYLGVSVLLRRLKVRSIGKSWTGDYQDHVISWTRVHDLNETQHKYM